MRNEFEAWAALAHGNTLRSCATVWTRIAMQANRRIMTTLRSVVGGFLRLGAVLTMLLQTATKRMNDGI